MDFANPFFLVALVGIPLLGWLRIRRIPTTLLYPFADGAIPENAVPLRAGRTWWVRFGLPSLRVLGLIALVLAMAGPRTPDLRTRIPAQGVAIVFVLDVSGSMDAKTFVWENSKISRKEAAARVFRLFVQGGTGPGETQFPGRSNEMGTDAIGLVTFANWPHAICPPTLNHAVLLQLLDDTRPPSILDTGTNIGDAIAEGLIHLENASPKRKVLILLTDGEHNFDQADPERRPLKPREAAQLAANLKIPIYTIDTGGDPAPDAKESERKQREAGRLINRTIAEMTQGRSFEADDAVTLSKVCQEIDQLERQPILSNSFRRYHEWYPWCVGFCLMAWLGAFILEQTWLRSIP